MLHYNSETWDLQQIEFENLNTVKYRNRKLLLSTSAIHPIRTNLAKTI